MSDPVECSEQKKEVPDANLAGDPALLTQAESLRVIAKQYSKDGKLFEASDAYSKVLQLMLAFYGGDQDCYPECAEAYFEYGAALLREAQAQSSFIGNTGQGETAAEPTAAGETSQPKGKEEAPQEPEQADEDLLKLSWQLLELARMACKDQLEKEFLLSEVLLTLGELEMENENFINAIEDLTECVTLRENVHPRNDRAIAEACLFLGFAYQYSEKVEESGPHFRKAINAIQARIDNLNKHIIDHPESKVEDEKELRECSEILDDLKLKVEESSITKSEREQTEGKLSDVTATMGTSSSGGSATVLQRPDPITDTGVRVLAVKRKGPEQDPDVKEPPLKK